CILFSRVGSLRTKKRNRLQWSGSKNYYVPPFVVLATSENADQSQQIWMPDTFFQNEKEARRHLIDKPNVLIRIHKDGSILYSVRLSLVLSCPMSLEFYPLDRQNCLIDLASYAYTTQDIKYEWKATNPVQQKDGLRQSLPSFELQDVVTKYCTSKTNTGEYSCLRTQMVLRREFSYYLLQLYIPSFMLVIVSWVSFWLDKDSVPARVTLGVTTLLTMTTQSSGINAKLPPVSYTKAIDVWIGVCLAFIFGALLEFALVNYAARKDMTNCGQRMVRCFATVPYPNSGVCGYLHIPLRYSCTYPDKKPLEFPEQLAAQSPVRWVWQNE
ncbi:unnamed protein product, partial [Nippostrongylus brasiliensis]|uniref:Ig-like domain-containing protein n=1 Tax=Nippostrongylus brasiliensis TaxID=27835 RepID=A0A0N4XG44_NIPBR